MSESFKQFSLDRLTEHDLRAHNGNKDNKLSALASTVHQANDCSHMIYFSFECFCFSIERMREKND